jgi:ribulose-5-phosphate 4-epimerase/fuculose-1-phosphate aldolase
MSLPTTAIQRLLADGPALCQVMSAIHQRGWCDGTGGNFSTVLCTEPLALLMAPSGVDKRSLEPADLIVVNGDGQVISGNGKASAETLLHLTIIATTRAGAVLHTHSQAATLLSRLQPANDAGNALWSAAAEADSSASNHASPQSNGPFSPTHRPSQHSEQLSTKPLGLSSELQALFPHPPGLAAELPSHSSESPGQSADLQSLSSEAPGLLPTDLQSLSAKAPGLSSDLQSLSSDLQSLSTESLGRSADSQTYSSEAPSLSADAQRLFSVTSGRFAESQKMSLEAQFTPKPEGLAATRSLLGYLRLTDLEMLKGLEGIHSHTTPIAIPILANSQDIRYLSQCALPHLASAPYGILIAGHGLYAWGDSLLQARRHLEIIEFLLEQHWRQKLLNALLSNGEASQ